MGFIGKTNHGKLSGEILVPVGGARQEAVPLALPEGNPYLRTETKTRIHRGFTEVAMAFASI
ncbi:Uncharacterised protein (plasmid) [Escherichia coli]|nr:Uncharacterised protein [Escherichia coli]